ncbi:MAG: hypothetical protein K9G39_10790 [Chlorobium sp.]|uniref:hypothetical protein n=1 Tax=Chlorobium sp. TaxID=1095 RepID=UPI0025B9AC69|nr:hypothetical protein [Chlorobium sp.]MCF8384054.1 hypothetical protein [Chlorobium sp.]
MAEKSKMGGEKSCGRGECFVATAGKSPAQGGQASLPGMGIGKPVISCANIRADLAKRVARAGCSGCATGNSVGACRAGFRKGGTRLFSLMNSSFRCSYGLAFS